MKTITDKMIGIKNKYYYKVVYSIIKKLKFANSDDQK